MLLLIRKAFVNLLQHRRRKFPISRRVFSVWLHELDELDAALERYDQERQRRRGDQSVTEKAAAPRRRQTKKKKP